ncbi:MAG: xanthine dehydrogenase family protein subunit M [Rhodospirillaceae bacterium]|nr:xanthine dehydrogenase family protein subunit M [Rhodospirillaceae bacterium]
MYEFDYARPASVADAAKAHQAGDDASYLAGGMTLIPTLKQRLARPSQLVDLSAIAEMKGITVAGGALTVGAMTCHADVAASAEVRKHIPALAVLAAGIGDPQVRNRGTIGGSLANNDPSADYPAAVLGLGATIHTNARTIAADGFFKGLFETALNPGEIIVKVAFPIPKRAGYAKLPNPASRYAVVGVMVAETSTGVRVAVTGAGPGVFRATDFEAALAKSFSADAIKSLKAAVDGLNADMHATAEYRAHLIGVMARRAVAAALGQGGG